MSTEVGIQLGRMAQVVNTLAQLMESGAPADITRALGLSCQFLQSLENRGGGAGMDGFVEQVWPAMVGQRNLAWPTLQELCANPESFGVFCDMEERLLVQAGVEPRVAQMLMTDVRYSGESLRYSEVSPKKFAARLRILRTHVCSFPGAQRVAAVLAANVAVQFSALPRPNRRYVWLAAAPTLVAVNAWLVKDDSMAQDLSVNLGAAAAEIFLDSFLG